MSHVIVQFFLFPCLFYYYVKILVLLARCIVFILMIKLTNCQIILNKHGACI